MLSFINKGNIFANYNWENFYPWQISCCIVPDDDHMAPERDSYSAIQYLMMITWLENVVFVDAEISAAEDCTVFGDVHKV